MGNWTVNGSINDSFPFSPFINFTS